MSDNFNILREATQACIEQFGASRNDELFDFRNVATFTVIHQLLRKYDRMREQAMLPVATHSLGELTAAEAALLHAFRQADDGSKITIQIAAEVSLQVAAKFATKERCDVVDISLSRSPTV